MGRVGLLSHLKPLSFEAGRLRGFASSQRWSSMAHGRETSRLITVFTEIFATGDTNLIHIR